MAIGSPKVRLFREVAGLLDVVGVSSVGAWFLPDGYHLMVVVGLLGLGLLFDLLSAFYHVMTLVTGKFSSGFPGVGLIFLSGFCWPHVFPSSAGE